MREKDVKLNDFFHMPAPPKKPAGSRKNFFLFQKTSPARRKDNGVYEVGRVKKLLRVHHAKKFQEKLEVRQMSSRRIYLSY